MKVKENRSDEIRIHRGKQNIEKKTHSNMEQRRSKRSYARQKPGGIKEGKKQNK